MSAASSWAFIFAAAVWFGLGWWLASYLVGLWRDDRDDVTDMRDASEQAGDEAFLESIGVDPHRLKH